MNKSKAAELLGQRGDNWITEDVGEYAAQNEIDEQAALSTGLKDKAEEFVASGRDL